MARRPKARGNREGTIYQRRKVVRGREYVYHIAEISWTDENDRVRRLRAERASRSEAVAALATLRDRVRAGRVPTAEVGRRTCGDILARWLVEAERRGLRPATLRSYRQIVTQHLVPRIGHLRVAALTRGRITTMLDDMAADGVGDRTVGLSYVLAKAALARYVVSDPEDHPFPRKGAPRSAKRDMQVWAEDEMQDFLRSARGHRDYALYLVALSTGMRQGEILGLRWGDIRDDHLTVRTSLDQVERKIGPTKNTGSRRRVDLDPDVVVELREHRARMRDEGHGVSREDLVFVTSAGSAMRASNLYRRSFRPLMEAAPVPIIRFHDLRHTAATVMLTRGVHPKVVSERLGHSSIRLTLDTYSHVLPTMQRSAIEATAGLFGRRAAKRGGSTAKRRSPAMLPGNRKAKRNARPPKKRKTLTV